MRDFYSKCGNRETLSLIAGPCVFENADHAIRLSDELRDIAGEVSEKYGLYINFIYKTSFDKANRTSADSYRGVGFDEAYYGMQTIRTRGTPVLTDVHDSWQCEAVNADIIQIPAFLCRQTDLLQAAANSGKPVNVKKGQFLSPQEMVRVVEKLERFGATQIMVTERGSTFGYNNLVVDMRGLEYMKRNCKGYPIIMDCTHAVQSPGGLGDKSGGDREMAKVIARAAAAVGVAGIFMEVHDDPDNAPSDGPNMIKLKDVYPLLCELIELSLVSRKWENNI